jgi:hypothetical protein
MREIEMTCCGDVTSIPQRGHTLQGAYDVKSISPRPVQDSIFDDKICTRCRQSKPRTEFYWNPTTRDRIDAFCRTCQSERAREYQRRNPERTRTNLYTRILKSKYGLTREQHAAMLEAQAGLCAICKQPPRHKKGLVVDHNHATGKVRALVCGHCNVALGLLDEDPTRLRAAAEYVEKHKGSE